ncbi:hypothetical protein M011DRAFT_470150 [Sporormia fimetaria CBS 119925]|uniref:Nucleotide-diphospho-sugar transferase domain-containing protein n=1 Tax=Sporormia fimetaria CBS 119925 TaxID=1340428 RepID=A0A6A6V6K5_9PLEO|nr:hypothetical protein M011DRAFT_470150 [Sporormia fimetaria CBS 119925]
MAAPNGHPSPAPLTPQGRWRRMLSITMLPMLLMLVYCTYGSNLFVQGMDTVRSQHHQQQQEAQLASPAHISSPPSSQAPQNGSQPAAEALSSPSPCPMPEEKEPVEDLSMAAVLEALYKPLLHPIDARNFTDEDGGIHFLSGTPRFTEKLGKKVLILDIDSRPLSDKGQIMDPELRWNTIRPLSAGMLSHYMYAQVHGYDYKFMRAPDYKDRWGTWVKVPLMKEALKTHDYIVFMDSDVMFHYPHLPLEWLLNYWHMTPETLVMMSIDPDEPQNYDDKGNRYLNTGFVVAQQSERTQEMFKHWAECPSETKYPGCGRWKKDWAHEQAAFGNYLRYDYDRPEDIKVLPCAEANGAPEAINRGGCKGVFVRHFWVDKGLLSKGLADTVMQYFMPRLHKMWMDPAAENIMDAKDHKLQGAELMKMKPGEKEAMEEEAKQNQKDEGY